jgi:hypothetical protein
MAGRRFPPALLDFIVVLAFTRIQRRSRLRNIGRGSFKNVMTITEGPSSILASNALKSESQYTD